MSRTRVGTPSDLERLREAARAAERHWRARVLICMTGCRSRGAIAVGEAFRAKVAAAGLQDEVAVVDVGCHGQCALAPVVVIEPQNYFYGGVQPNDVDEIIEVTLRGGRPAERLCQRLDGNAVATAGEAPFYRSQQRDVLAHCGASIPSRSTTRSRGAPMRP